MKYLFFDLDDTLLDSHKQVPEKTVEYLRRLKEEKGLILGVASGREPSAIYPTLEKTKLISLIGVLVASCGGEIIDHRRNTHQKFHMIPVETIREVRDFYADKKNGGLYIRAEEDIYASKDLEIGRPFFRVDGQTQFLSLYEKEPEEVFRLIILFNTKEDLEACKEECMAHHFKDLLLLYTRDYLYEYIDERNSKSAAAKSYVESYGDTLDDVLFFGDSVNDLDMLENCGRGVAMINGSEIAKNAADDITEYSCDEEGVRKYLEKYFEDPGICFEEVKKGETDKIKELSALATSIVREHYDPILGKTQNDYMLEKFQSVQAISEQLEDRYIYYLVKEGKEDLGFIGFYPREEDLYLSKLYLKKNERRRHIGKKMMDFVIAEAKRFHRNKITLNVNRYNDDSIAFYEHYGYKRIREEDNDIGSGYYMNDYVYEFTIKEKD